MFSFKNLTRKKPIEKSVDEEIVPTYRLYDLITYGIAATVGSGVYAVVGRTAREVGGSIVLSTGLSGLVSLITAFCYLEFASKIPASGSSYTYAYSTIGELIGWFIGWNLTLEYSFAAASIAGAWSQSYLPAMFKNINANSMISDNILPQYLYNLFPSESGEFRINIMAGLLIGVFTLLALMGTKAGSKFNNFITSLNLLVILVIIIFGLTHFNIDNMDNFFKSGFEGVSKGAQQMFFSYIGFDTICTLSAEAKRPKKDIPIAVMTTIAVATTLYIGAGLSIVGMVGADNITKDSPLINAFESVGKPLVGKLVGGCALLCMMATLFACIVGQPRIFYAMAKDGLLPKRFGVLNKGGNATFGIIFTGLITALNAMFIHDEYTEDMVSFGSLLGFSVIAA
ncbi:amino acid transporter, partial [Rozella allomycis CSF55]